MNQAKPFASRRAPSNRARQRGASLLEGIAYLGIAALVVLGAVSLLTNAFGSAKANQTSEEVVSLRTAVRKLYAGQLYNADATMMANVIAARAIPNTLRINGAQVDNSWGGTVTLAGATATTFSITYTALPRDVCMGVVSGATGWAQISNLAALNAFVAFPASAANAATVCSADTNTVVFTAN